MNAPSATGTSYSAGSVAVTTDRGASGAASLWKDRILSGIVALGIAGIVYLYWSI